MNLLTFDEPRQFVPNTAQLPAEWRDYTFDSLDFCGPLAEFKNLLASYLENFELKGRDSLFLYPSQFAYKVLVSLFKEVAYRTTADAYRFLNWPEYAAKLSSLGRRAEGQLLADLSYVRYIFLFDLTVSMEDHYPLFELMLRHAYTNKIPLFICSTTTQKALSTWIRGDMKAVFTLKFLSLNISDA